MPSFRFDRWIWPKAFAHGSRRSIRLRLTMTYAALFLISGAILLTIGYQLVAHVFPDPTTHDFARAAKREAAIAPGHPSPAALIAQDQHKRDLQLHRLLVDYLVVLGAMSLLSIALGWLAATKVLRPVQRITTATRSISARNLHERLALAGPKDELKELGDTIDALLTRLQRSFDFQRRFIANASHELRTPLALQQALLEATLTDPAASPASWRATCERALAAAHQQARLITSLLALARSETEIERPQPVDLDQIADRVLSARQLDAERQRLTLMPQLGAAPTGGDPPLIERLITNLLDNALHHNVDQGWIQITTGTSHQHAVVSVANTGPPVSAADLPRLLEPFQRLATDRIGHNGRLGLGLSIVRAIATAHNAQLDIRPGAEGGLAIEVRFPLRASRAPIEHDRASQLTSTRAAQSPDAVHRDLTRDIKPTITPTRGRSYRRGGIGLSQRDPSPRSPTLHP